MTEPGPVAPEVGDPAPPFTGTTTHGETLGLTDLSGGEVLLFFFPFAFSGICTSELTGLRDRHAEFAAAGVRVLGCSTDPMYALRVFADRERLPFDLLSDFWPHGRIARSYGVFADGPGCPLRASFLIDRDGRVRWSMINALGDPRDLDRHRAALPTMPTRRRTG